MHSERIVSLTLQYFILTLILKQLKILCPQIFLGCIIGSMSLGHAFPVVEVLGNARGAAQRVYSIIEKESNIDPLDSKKGEKPDKFQGTVSLKDVYFSYPARPTITVSSKVEFKGIKVETLLSGPHLFV